VLHLTGHHRLRDAFLMHQVDRFAQFPEAHPWSRFAERSSSGAASSFSAITAISMPWLWHLRERETEIGRCPHQANGRISFHLLEVAGARALRCGDRAEDEAARSWRFRENGSIGEPRELSKAIDLMHSGRLTQAVMAGQVKHNKIFSSIRPDWNWPSCCFLCRAKNTDTLIGVVARVLEDEGIVWWIRLVLNRWGLKRECLRDARRTHGRRRHCLRPRRRAADSSSGHWANRVISDRACVAVEAMEAPRQSRERTNCRRQAARGGES